MTCSYSCHSTQKKKFTTKNEGQFIRIRQGQTWEHVIELAQPRWLMTSQSKSSTKRDDVIQTKEHFITTSAQPRWAIVPRRHNRDSTSSSSIREVVGSFFKWLKPKLFLFFSFVIKILWLTIKYLMKNCRRDRYFWFYCGFVIAFKKFVWLRRGPFVYLIFLIFSG